MQITEINNEDEVTQAPVTTQPGRKGKRQKKEQVMNVQSVRRSDRLAGLAAGFKDQKSAKNAGECSQATGNLETRFEAAVLDENEAPPPHLPVETLQVIGATHCKMPPTVLSEAALNNTSSNDSD